jgi:hypothetical protein
MRVCQVYVLKLRTSNKENKEKASDREKKKIKRRE